MDFSLLQIPKVDHESDVSLKDFVKLVKYIRSPNQDAKNVPVRPYNEYSAAVIDSAAQFQAVNTLERIFKKKKAPMIIRDVSSSPNKLSYVVRLINNIFLIFNSQNEKVTVFQPPPCRKCFYELPDCGQMKRWQPYQDHVYLKLVRCETVHYYAVSDFGDLLVVFQTYQMYFDFQTYTAHKLGLFNSFSQDSAGIQLEYNCQFIPTSNNMLQSDRCAVVSQVVFGSQKIEVTLKEVDLARINERQQDDSNVVSLEQTNKKDRQHARGVSHGVSIRTVTKTIFVQNQQEEFNDVRSCLLSCGNILYLLVNNSHVIQLSYCFSGQPGPTSVVKRDTHFYVANSAKRVPQQLSPCHYASAVCGNQFLFTEEDGKSDCVTFLHRICIQKELMKYNVVRDSKKAEFVKFNTSVDNNVMIILFSDFFMVFATPVLIHTQKYDSYTLKGQETESIIYQNRTFIIKQNQNSYMAFNLNIQYDRNQLVSYPDRFCDQTMKFTMLQNVAMRLGSIESLAEIYPVIDFLLNNITETQLIILQSAVQAANQYIPQLLQEQFQLDTQITNQILQIILKFIQIQIKEARYGAKINYLKLLKFRAFMNNYSQSALQPLILQEFNTQFLSLYVQKYSLTYFKQAMESYATAQDKNIYNLNFEEHYIAGQQLLCYAAVMSRINTKQFYYLDVTVLQTACMLLGLAFDIAYAKQIVFSKLVLKKYLGVLSYIGLTEVAKNQNVLQLPAILVCLFNSTIRLCNGGKQYKPIVCSQENFIDQLLTNYSYIVDGASFTNHRFNIIAQYKACCYRNQTPQKYLASLRNGRHNSAEQNFYFELLLNDIMAQGNAEQLFMLMMDQNTVMSLQNQANRFKEGLQLSYQQFNFANILKNLLYAVSSNYRSVQLASERSLINLDNFKLQLDQFSCKYAFNACALAVSAVEDASQYLKVSVGLLKNGLTRHCVAFLDYCCNLYDLRAVQKGQRDPAQRQLIQYRTYIKDQIPLLQREVQHFPNLGTDDHGNNKKSLVRPDIVETNALPDNTNILVGSSAVYHDNDILRSKSQAQPTIYQQQGAENTDASGMQDIDPQLAQDVQNYDPTKEISMINIEGNGFLSQNPAGAPESVPAAQTAIPIPQSQNELLSLSGLDQSSRPMQIKRIRVADLVGASRGPAGGAPPAEAESGQPQHPLTLPSKWPPQPTLQQQNTRVQIAVPTHASQERPHAQQVRLQNPTQLPLVSYHQQPLDKRPQTTIVNPGQPPKQMQPWQQTHFFQPPGPHNSLQRAATQPVANLQQPRARIPLQPVSYTKRPAVPRQPQPQISQRQQESEAQAWQNNWVYSKQDHQNALDRQQQENARFQQAPAQHPPISQPQYTWPERQSQQDADVPIQQAKATYRVCYASKKPQKRTPFNYELIKDAIGPQVRELEEDRERQAPRSYAQISKELEGVEKVRQDAPEGQALAQVPQQPSSVSSVHSNHNVQDYPAYVSGFQPQQYQTPQPQIMPEVRIDSSLIKVQSPALPQVPYQPTPLPKDDVLDQIDDLLAKAQQGKAQTAAFLEGNGRAPAVPIGPGGAPNMEEALLGCYRQMQAAAMAADASITSDSGGVHGLTDALQLFK